MKVLAFSTSNSSKSINRALVNHAANVLQEKIIPDAEVTFLDINDYEMPLYSSDREEASGIPDLAQQFYNKIGEADALLISFPEHNGYYTAAYKNLFDWTSRIGKVYQGKPAVLMATSPGGHGAANVLKSAQESAPHFTMLVKGVLSVPSFYDNFDMETGQLSNDELQEKLEAALAGLKS